MRSRILSLWLPDLATDRLLRSAGAPPAGVMPAEVMPPGTRSGRSPPSSIIKARSGSKRCARAPGKQGSRPA